MYQTRRYGFYSRGLEDVIDTHSRHSFVMETIERKNGTSGTSRRYFSYLISRSDENDDVTLEIKCCVHFSLLLVQGDNLSITFTFHSLFFVIIAYKILFFTAP